MRNLRSNIYYWKCDRPGAFQKVASERKHRPGLRAMLLGELRRTFPGTELTLHPGNGQGNHITYIAATPDWKGFVRIEDGPEGDDFMDVESAIIEMIRSYGVPAPAVHAVDASRRHVPFAWQVLEWIEDSDLNKLNKSGQLNLSTISRAIGRYIGKWQQVPTDGFGPFNPDVLRQYKRLQGYHADYSSYFFVRLRRHIAFLREHEFLDDAGAEEILEAIRVHADLLNVSQGCLVHKDLALWNILGTPDSITAFIDWEDAISGDPLDDFSLLGCFHSGDVICEALEGYRSVHPLPENHRRRFWLHLLRNMLVKAVIRIGSGFFDRSDDLFLIGAGATGTDLKSFTHQRIETALRGLQEDQEIAELR